jgi:ComF family protein
MLRNLLFSNITKLDFAGLFIPHKCALCLIACEDGFCTYCHKLLPWIGNACYQCASPLPRQAICGRCQSSPPPFDNAIIPFLYRQPISKQIQSLKYGGQVHLANAFGKTLASRILQSNNPLADIIIPVPLHWRRIFNRGFNQSTEIARVVGKQLGIPISTDLLVRKKNTVTQTDLDIKMRFKNTRNAFAAKSTNLPRHIALVDDVVTTGSTIISAAKTLKKAGVSEVSIWAIATT